MKIVFLPREHIWPSLTDDQRDEMLEAGAEEVVVTDDRATQLAEVRDADALIGPIDPELFERAGRLRWVQSLSSGVDALLFPEFVESDVILTSEKGLVGPHLADHAFALLLSLTRSITWAARQRTWANRLEMRRANRELSGMTIGLVGLGGTGTETARRAMAFGMRCLAIDPDVTEQPVIVEWLGQPDQLEEMARDSDVLAVCCPLTTETRGMIDAKIFSAMPAGSYVVSVTRGGIIDEAALVDALTSGHIAGAGLDVAAEEPLPDNSPLWSIDNVVITPHTAGASQHRIDRVRQRVFRNIRQLRDGEPLEGLIDKHKGY